MAQSHVKASTHPLNTQSMHGSILPPLSQRKQHPDKKAFFQGVPR
jgi:hypothetical protein